MDEQEVEAWVTVILNTVNAAATGNQIKAALRQTVKMIYQEGRDRETR